ncbi:uncharacterized protein LOC121523088 isoform X2 [Cheilinus undulatus]|uniref:uncharacterized protein LOC121523088 isoform X2 n=1 Tax=Cheilinus undulatus TaxID=241271 RepID=UPI001BD2A9C2|nr:uncharacterized protein LOC121523088 isoform X2 [Cheilinus undulatus]
MHRQKQAALLSLLFMSEVFAENYTKVHTDVPVYRGDSKTFICNTSRTDTSQVRWTKDNFLFSHLFSKNQTFSNFSSDRVKIEIDSPSKLIISNVQDDDKGLYICNITERRGPKSYRWNLTVLQKPEGGSLTQYFFHYFLPSGMAVFLCCIISAICLCRKLRAKTPNQNQIQDQSYVESAEERGTERRTNKRRSQYMERLNSIYNAY